MSDQQPGGGRINDPQDLFKIGCPTRVYFIASQPAIENAIHHEIFYNKEDARKPMEWTQQILKTPLKIYSALVVVEEETND